VSIENRKCFLPPLLLNKLHDKHRSTRLRAYGNESG
jgi:hypothetical protein